MSRELFQADEKQMKKLRSVHTQLENLALELRASGDFDVSDACKRAAREIDLVDRQGLFTARGVEL